MKLYITLNKKNLSIILASVIIIFILFGQFLSANSGGIDGSTNEKRIQYLSRLGLEVNQTAVKIKDITIPEKFSSEYQDYNLLQIKSGFNLKNHKGKSATVYTYKLNDKEQVNLIILKDKIIGGDITELETTGRIKALTKEK